MEFICFILFQIPDDETEDECVKMFWRGFAENGMLNSLHSNSVGYDDFK